MAKVSIEQRIAQLEAQKKALKARLTKQERAKDTRRKVLLGALILHRLDDTKNPADAARMTEWLRRELPGFLTRDIDKELFPDLVLQPAGNETTNGSGTETVQGRKEVVGADNDAISNTPESAAADTSDQSAINDDQGGSDRAAGSGRTA